MPAFFSRRYVRRTESLGRVEKTLAVVLPLALVLIIILFIRQSVTDTNYLFNAESDDAPASAGTMTAGPAATPASSAKAAPAVAAAPADAGGKNPFPAPGVDGWTTPAGVTRFTPDNLYEKIDGRASLYQQFHFVGMTFGTYPHAEQPDRSIDVFWYDMGEPENALGIFRTEASEDGTAVDIGQAGYATGGAVFFIKGTQYVQVLPGGQDEADAKAALEIARKIGETIKDAGGGSWALNVLPSKGRIADSFQYITEDAFGQSFLKEIFTADYERDGGRVTLFIHKAKENETAASLMDKYTAYFEEDGKVVWKDPDAARRIVAGDASGVLDVVFVKGPYFGGVSGAANLETAKAAAVEFYDGLAVP